MNLCKYCGSVIPTGTYNYKTSLKFYCSKTCTKMHWKKQNKIKVAEQAKEYKQRNKIRLQVYNAFWRQGNRELISSYQSTRYRRVQQATPLWANREDILNVYIEAEYFQLEVDHIIPIKHPLVCGLHVWDNLQLLSRSENATKKNKFIIE